MSDIIDHASHQEAQFNEVALASQLKRTKQAAEMSKQTSATECIECGEEIPVMRRIHAQGCQFCVLCQSLIEQGKL